MKRAERQSNQLPQMQPIHNFPRRDNKLGQSMMSLTKSFQDTHEVNNMIDYKDEKTRNNNKFI